MSTIDGASIQDEISIFEQSSPESLRRARALSPRGSVPHTYSSTSVSDDRTLNVDTDDDYFSEHKPLKQCTSSRSSISSFPASVIHTIPYTDTEDNNFRTLSRTQSYDRTNKSPGPGHGYLSAFRNSSSVRALQLESEYADSDAISLRHSPRPRRSPNVSYLGTRSPASTHSSPTKRSSRPGTPQQRTQSNSKLKKEAFPLVLLHCTLLPPAVAAHGPLVSDEILEAVLPEQYRKRWRTLREKVVKNNEVKTRGVLIPHPREDYELLEESLLETLELERPRIRHGHYLGGSKNGGSDSGFESESQNGSEEAVEENVDEGEGGKCLDCGKAVSCKAEQERRWEVKVFAANGLMRSGAWAAAWEQMEKVDVEVGMWMPEDTRIEVEERLKALQAKEEAEAPLEQPVEVKKRMRRVRNTTAKLKHDERMREIYGEPEPKTQEEIDGLVDDQEKIKTPPAVQFESDPQSTTDYLQSHDGIRAAFEADKATPAQHPTRIEPGQEDFPTFMQRHINLIWNDQRNLAIVLLSMLVLFFSVQNADLSGTIRAATASNTTQHHHMSPNANNDMSTAASAPILSYVTETVYAMPSPDPASAPNVEQLWEPLTESPRIVVDPTVEVPMSYNEAEAAFTEVFVSHEPNPMPQESLVESQEHLQEPMLSFVSELDRDSCTTSSGSQNLQPTSSIRLEESILPDEQPGLHISISNLEEVVQEHLGRASDPLEEVVPPVADMVDQDVDDTVDTRDVQNDFADAAIDAMDMSNARLDDLMDLQTEAEADDLYSTIKDNNAISIDIETVSEELHDLSMDHE